MLFVLTSDPIKNVFLSFLCMVMESETSSLFMAVPIEIESGSNKCTRPKCVHIKGRNCRGNSKNEFWRKKFV